MRKFGAFIEQKQQECAPDPDHKPDKRKEPYDDIFNRLPEQVEYKPPPWDNKNQSTPHELHKKAEDAVIKIIIIEKREQNPVPSQDLFDEFLFELDVFP